MTESSSLAIIVLRVASANFFTFYRLKPYLCTLIINNGIIVIVTLRFLFIHPNVYLFLILDNIYQKNQIVFCDDRYVLLVRVSENYCMYMYISTDMLDIYGRGNVKV